MATVTQIGPRLGIAPTCAALGLPRATYYRRRRPARTTPTRRRSPRALGEAARATVLATAYAAHPERFSAGLPAPAPLPTEVWINPPTRRALAEVAHTQ